MEIKRITSAQNEYIKKLARLSSKKHREETGLYLAEGEHLAEMAIVSGCNIQNILMTEEYYVKNSHKYDVEVTIVPESIIEKISDAKTPQGVIAVIKMEDAQENITSGRYIYCDDLQDPGNVGTVIRTADAFSFDGVILTRGSADVYSPKVIRSSQGSVFNIKIIRNGDAEFLKKAKKDFFVTSTALYGESVELKNMKVEKNHIFVIGNEGSGVSKEILDISDEIAYIPMSGKAESLNAGVAASILMYEVANRE